MKTLPEIKLVKNDIKLPTWGDRKDFVASRDTRGYAKKFDEFFLHFLEPAEAEKWVDVWLKPEAHEIYCVKRCDAWTAGKLYGRELNPVTLSFHRWEDRLGVNATLHSVDDSYFGQHRYGLTRMEGLEVIKEMKTWLDKTPVVNGQAWWDLGKALGFQYQFDN